MTSSRVMVGLMCWILASGLNPAFSQVIWDGEAGDGMWNTPLNWSGNKIPTTADLVILDNSFVTGDYEVILGGNAQVVSIEQIRIIPSINRSVSLVISTDNTLAPALVCNGEGYGLYLGPGATFRNASGASSGAPLEIADSIWISNGAHFIHNTARSHAANVRALSRAPGTESGEFEFRIPVSSSTVSISGQVFGRLKLSTGPTGTINYTGTGTNDLIIRNDLEIATGVNLNFNLEGQVLIMGHFIQRGGTCNLGTTARKLEMHLGGNLMQATGGIITETGSASPLLQLIGPGIQTVNLSGSITNNVAMQVNNTSGIVLETDLSISYLLILASGIVRTGDHALVLGDSALLQVNGRLEESFIEGKIKKVGLTGGDFMFPVGKNGVVRWVGLKQATGNFLIEFVRSDPRQIEAELDTGLAHISGLEYWQITAEGEEASASVELSFDGVNSGGVTALDQLRAVYLHDKRWINAGNVGTTGSPGSSGSVTSRAIGFFATGIPTYFTLASSQATQNPLPVTWRWFRVFARPKDILIEWSIEDGDAEYYLVERSADARQFEVIGKTIPFNGRPVSSFNDLYPLFGESYYRVVGVNARGEKISSTIRTVRYGRESSGEPVVYAGKGIATLYFPAAGPGIYLITVYDSDGRLVHLLRSAAGSDRIEINLANKMISGKIIIVHVTDPGGKRFTKRVMLY